MSNQNATHNRVTLLESIEAARRSIEVCQSFHTISTYDRSKARAFIALDLLFALTDLRKAETKAAVLEAWGDGP